MRKVSKVRNNSNRSASDQRPRHTTQRTVSPATSQATSCRFCRNRKKYIDYKDIETLAKLLTNRGKIYSRKRSGNCAGCQRKMKRAIKLARFMALLPYTT